MQQMAGPNSGLIECVYSEANAAYDTHFHNSHEIIFVVAGNPHVIICGKEYQAQPGCIFFINNLEKHSIYLPEGTYHRYYIRFSPAQLNSMIDKPELRSVFTNRAVEYNHEFQINDAKPEAERIFAALLGEYLSPGPCSVQYISALFVELLVLCCRQCPSQFHYQEGRPAKLADDIQRFIDDHYADNLSVAKLAERFYLSESYLSHVFKKFVGLGPQQYLLNSRISCAKELLCTTTLPVSRVAEQSGFKELSSFIRTFKKSCDMPPLTYRKQTQKQESF
jgi:AraC-like DNA-binding protein